MTKAEIRDNWLRNYHACLTPESKLGSLRGASRDGVLPEVLKALKIVTAANLFENLHQGGALHDAERFGEEECSLN